jgi:type II pantothenate kinase
MKLGIDFGFSSTKYVIEQGIVQKGILPTGDIKKIIEELVAKHPDIQEIYLTGGKTKVIKLASLEDIEKPIEIVSEINAIGRGGLKLFELEEKNNIKQINEVISVSCGTGVAIVQVQKCEKNGKQEIISKHLGGTGIGGGTLLALSKKILGIADISKLNQLAMSGNLSKIDLRIKDIVGDEIGTFGSNITAANLAKITKKHDIQKQDIQKHDIKKQDLAAGIMNLVTEAFLSHCVIINNLGLSDEKKVFILLGRLAQIPYIHKRVNELKNDFGFQIIIPDLGAFGPAIGAVSR